MQYYQQALQALALSVPNEDYYPLPILEGYNSAVELLETLPAKTATFRALYAQEQRPQNLIAAIAHYHCADELIDQMRRSFKMEGSKLMLAEKSKTATLSLEPQGNVLAADNGHVAVLANYQGGVQAGTQIDAGLLQNALPPATSLAKDESPSTDNQVLRSFIDKNTPPKGKMRWNTC